MEGLNFLRTGTLVELSEEVPGLLFAEIMQIYSNIKVSMHGKSQTEPRFHMQSM